MKSRTSLSKTPFVRFEWRKKINWRLLLTSSPTWRIQAVKSVLPSARGDSLTPLFSSSLVLLIIFQKRASLFKQNNKKEKELWMCFDFGMNVISSCLRGKQGQWEHRWRREEWKDAEKGRPDNVNSFSLRRNATLTVWYRTSITRSVHPSQLPVCLLCAQQDHNPVPDPTWTVLSPEFPAGCCSRFD